MFYPLKSRLNLKIRIKRSWVKDKDGVTAVEFSLIAFPLFLLVFGMIEIGFLFGAATMLESGTIQATRIVRTGQVQAAADPAETFATELCNRVNILIDCNELFHEVILIPDNDFLRAGDFPPQYDADGNLIPQGFDPGGPSDVVLVRTSYLYPYFTPFLSAFLDSDGDDGVRMLTTTVIRNEPYEE